MTQQAAWIKEAHAKIVVEEAEIPTPGPGELLVKVKAIAFSPLEAKIQKLAMIPIPYPNILGLSFSGTVESVGPDVTNFKAGDNVATVRDGPKAADPRFGGFQQYALTSQTSTAKLPEGVSLESGASTALNLVATYAAMSVHIGLDRPSLTGKTQPNGKKVLIYGGSSPAGGLVVNYASLAGYDVTTTSSPKHKDFVKSLGPSSVIDHTQSEAEVVKEIKSQGPYEVIFDAIGLPPVHDLLGNYIHSIGGGTYYSFGLNMKPLPEDVKCSFAPYSLALDKPENSEARSWYYNELLPKALEKKLIVPTRAKWLQGGLATVQEALDLMMEGKVSGEKLLLDPSA